MFGLEPCRVVFTGGGTEANQVVLLSAVLAAQPRPHVIATAIEHASVLRVLACLDASGLAEVTWIPCDGAGFVDVARVAAAVRASTCLLTAIGANHETGAIQPLRELGRVAREAGAAFHTDAVALFGKAAFDLRDWHADYVTLAAHKWHGPKGVGMILFASGRPLKPCLGGGSQEQGVRAGTQNVPVIAGAATAIRAVHTDEDVSMMREQRDRLWRGLQSSVPSMVLNTPMECAVANTLNVSFAGVHGDALRTALDMRGISVGTGAACHSASRDPSPTLLAMGRSPAQARSAIRFSVSRETAADDVVRAVHIVAAEVTRLRRISTT